MNGLDGVYRSTHHHGVKKKRKKRNATSNFTTAKTVVGMLPLAVDSVIMQIINRVIYGNKCSILQIKHDFLAKKR